MSVLSPASPSVGNAQSNPPLLWEDIGDIAVLTLNRARGSNTLSEEMLAAISEALAEISGQTGVRCVIITAEGSVFSAGHDLREFSAHRADADGGRGYTQDIMQRCSAMMLAIVRLPQPVIAAVEGTATAAGCQLVAACDLAVASSMAKFSTPGVHIGLFCSTPMVALARNVARKHAMEMLLTGDMISADDAFRIGLINRVVEPGAAREQALELARRIAAKSAAVVKLGKQAFYKQIDMNIADAYAYASEVMVENMMARDAGEGISAFLEKRLPKWGDR
ncbi:MAG TPA: enoyl-CoA hydratase [Xanthobacteraceae bacterium]|jgi:enoyl-CoA hydratase/carnithine racemase